VPGPNEKDIKINVVIDEDVRGAKKASKALAETRQEADKASHSFKMMSGSAKDLEAELKVLTEQRAQASKRYLQTGNNEYLAEERRIGRQIGLYKKLLGNMGGGTPSASGPGIGEMFKGGGSPALIGGIGALVAAAAPALGAMIGGLISGAVVTVGLAGGIAAATKDAGVRAAAKDFGQTVSREFFASGDSFVGPVRQALGGLKKDFQSLDLAGTFERAAPFVGEFAGGIGDLFKNLMPGFNKVMDRAGPFVEELADGLGDLGGALGTMMDDMSSSEGAVEGLELLFRLLNGTLIGLGKTVNFLSDAWDLYTDVMAGVSGFMEDIPAWLQGPMQQFWQQTNNTMESMNQAGKDAAEGIDAFSGAAGSAAGPVNGLAAAMRGVNTEFDKYFNMQAALDDTTIAMKKAFLDFGETLKENGKHWEGNTEAGLENQAALRDVVDAIKAKRDAEIAASDGSVAAIEEINRKYNASIEKLRKMASEAGITKAMFENLAGSYKVVWNVTTIGQSPKFPGMMMGSATVTVGKDGVGSGKMKEFASGGSTPAGEIYKVHKDELLFSSRQHYVATAAQSRAIESGGGMGGGKWEATLKPGADSALAAALLSALRDLVWIKGGGSVQKAFGQ